MTPMKKRTKAELLRMPSQFEAFDEYVPTSWSARLKRRLRQAFRPIGAGTDSGSGGFSHFWTVGALSRGYCRLSDRLLYLCKSAFVFLKTPIGSRPCRSVLHPAFYRLAARGGLARLLYPFLGKSFDYGLSCIRRLYCDIFH